ADHPAEEVDQDDVGGENSNKRQNGLDVYPRTEVDVLTGFGFTGAAAEDRNGKRDGQDDKEPTHEQGHRLGTQWIDAGPGVRQSGGAEPEGHARRRAEP